MPEHVLRLERRNGFWTCWELSILDHCSKQGLSLLLSRNRGKVCTDKEALNESSKCLMPSPPSSPPPSLLPRFIRQPINTGSLTHLQYLHSQGAKSAHSHTLSMCDGAYEFKREEEGVALDYASVTSPQQTSLCSKLKLSACIGWSKPSVRSMHDMHHQTGDYFDQLFRSIV